MDRGLIRSIVGATAALCPLAWLATWAVVTDGPLVACVALVGALTALAGWCAIRAARLGARAARRTLR